MVSSMPPDSLVMSQRANSKCGLAGAPGRCISKMRDEVAYLCVSSDLTQTVGKHWIKSNDFGGLICKESVCGYICMFGSDSYLNTHIRAECNSSQWNVLTTKMPRIALVDNKTDTHTSPPYSPVQPIRVR